MSHENVSGLKATYESVLRNSDGGESEDVSTEAEEKVKKLSPSAKILLGLLLCSKTDGADGEVAEVKGLLKSFIKNLDEKNEKWKVMKESEENKGGGSGARYAWTREQTWWVPRWLLIGSKSSQIVTKSDYKGLVIGEWKFDSNKKSNLEGKSLCEMDGKDLLKSSSSAFRMDWKNYDIDQELVKKLTGSNCKNLENVDVFGMGKKVY